MLAPLVRPLGGKTKRHGAKLHNIELLISLKTGFHREFMLLSKQILAQLKRPSSDDVRGKRSNPIAYRVTNLIKKTCLLGQIHTI